MLSTALRHGEEVAVLQKPVSPFVYSELYRVDSQWLIAIVFMLVGCLLVLGLEWFATASADLAEEKGND